MKYFTSLFTLLTAFAVTAIAQAGNLDKQELEIIELKQRINQLEKNQSLDELDYLNAGEGKINEWLTLSGYIEMSFLSSEFDDGTTTTDADSMGVGIVDLDFSFDFSDNFKAFIDVTADDGGLDLYVQEAWGQYFFYDNVFSLRFGRQDVAIGLEASEAVNLYQFSNAAFYEFGYMPNYTQGIMAIYERDKFTLRAGFFDGLWSTAGNAYGLFESIEGGANGSDVDTHMAIMLSATIKFNEGGTIQATYAYEEEEDATHDDEWELFSFWITQKIGEKFEIAAELSFFEEQENTTDSEIMHALIRGTYQINDKWSVTLRYDRVEEDEVDATDDEKVDSFIISPAVKVNDHLSILFEAGWRDGDGDFDDVEEEWYALEAFITF